MSPEVEWLWPTPIGIHQFPAAERVNPLLVATFAEGRAAIERARGVAASADPFFASEDDLLHRVKLEEWQDLIVFIASGLGATIEAANAAAWAGRVSDLRVGFQGMWFQISRDGAFHDIHTHGNCSWSGVYIVQIDDPADRVTHPVYGAANGVTRLYGPHFATLGGGWTDAGTAYLQPPHQDVAPRAGQLLVFPSWLAHKAMPYAGNRDRVIISFNATVHSGEGDQLEAYAAV